MDEDFAALGAELLKLKAEGRTLKELADILNSRGVLTGIGTGRWHPTNVRSFLIKTDNGAYKSTKTKAWDKLDYMVDEAMSLRRKGMVYSDIATHFNSRGWTTARDRAWGASEVYSLVHTRGDDFVESNRQAKAEAETIAFDFIMNQLTTQYPSLLDGDPIQIKSTRAALRRVSEALDRIFRRARIGDGP